MRNFKEKLMKFVFLISACFSVFSVILICGFIFANGVPAIAEIGVFKFLLGTSWKPGQNVYGILPMIIGSIYITAGAILVGVPIGILSAVFMARYCPAKIYKPLKEAINLLAGIPSIVYGFFGMVVIVPVIQTFFGGSGNSILTASILLGIMILPTVITVSESAIRAVPKTFLQGSLALGATKERSIFKAEFPAAKSGILAGVILGIGRAIGETMAVVMVAGNQPILPQSLTFGIRTMTANIVLEMGYAADLHKGALIATATVLFVFILIINLSFSALKKGGK